MKRFQTPQLLMSCSLLAIALTIGCGSDVETPPALTESAQEEIAAEDAQVAEEEMQQMGN